MLDCDASFVSVPEFASIRRSLPARLKAATALQRGLEEAATKTGSATGQMSERQIGETFTSAMCPAFFDHLPAFDMPPIPVPPLADLRAEAARSFAPAPAGDDAEAEDAAPAATDEAEAEQRPVTPRRPLRFTSARSADESAPVSLPSMSLFDGVFDETTLDGPGIDPRLQRSRARALARLAAVEATLTPVERNLWHDDPEPVVAAAPVAVPSDAVILHDQPLIEDMPRAEGAVTPRRHVRHLTPASMARTPRPMPQIHDPLRDRLRDLRDVLYAPPTEDEVAAAEPQRPQVAQRALALLMPLVVLLMGLFVTARQAVPSLHGPVARFMARALPAPRLAPRLAMATAALAAIATPVGLMVSPGMLPFL